MKRLAIIMTIFLLATVSASAQRAIGEDTVQELQKRSSAFIALIYQGDYQKAFDFIRGYPSSISTENLDSLQATAAVQLEDIKQLYGEKLEVQYIGYNSLSNFLLRFVYVIRYEWHLVWWQVVYYRGAEDAWLCTSVSYENDYEALFDLTY